MSWSDCEEKFEFARNNFSDQGGRNLAEGLLELTRQLQRLDRKVEDVKTSLDRIYREMD